MLSVAKRSILKKNPKVSCGAGILPANHQGRASCPSHKIG